MRHLRALLTAAASILLATACTLNPPSNTPPDPNRQVGFGKPTIEVTVNGVHFGPATPDSGSRASLVNVKDAATGRIQQSIFRLTAGASSVGALCVLSATRTGDGVAPITTGPGYVFAETGAEGTVAPIEGEGIQIPQGVLQCSGSSCNGSGLQLTTIDAQHAEGFFSGVLTASGGTGNTVCSFYVPVSDYRP